MKKVAFHLGLIALCVMVVAGVVSAQTYKEVISFNGNSAAGPGTPLTQGTDGALYGMTAYGGTGGCLGNVIGCGVIFRVAKGQFQILYNFQPTGLIYPYFGLVLAPSGNFYGVAIGGGPGGYGVTFEVTPQGNLSVIHQFLRGDDAGYNPSAAPTLGIDGNFYGATTNGGAPSNSCPYGCGTIYKMTPAGDLTTLYSFCPQNYCPDGEEPVGALAQGLDGNFYGTAGQGGLYKKGTIFKITPSGKFTSLYTFENFSPTNTGLILGNDGNFYGMTGSSLYQVTPEGTVTELPGFSGEGADLPVLGSDGNFYWPAYESGYSKYGGLFEMPPNGKPVSLYAFAGYPDDGSEPEASLVQATNGTFYGTTYSGGGSPCNYGEYPGCGTVFSLDMGLPPFVAFVNRAARVGQKFGILGQGFLTTSSVSVNGTPASFTIKSKHLLVATVPAGATSGNVTVTTSSGVLTSNVPFFVIP